MYDMPLGSKISQRTVSSESTLMLNLGSYCTPAGKLRLGVRAAGGVRSRADGSAAVLPPLLYLTVSCVCTSVPSLVLSAPPHVLLRDLHGGRQG